MAIRRRETNDGVRYDVQWRLPDRSKRKKTFKTERQARQFEARLVTSTAAGERVDPRGGKVLLRVVYQSWLASRPDLSAKVRRGLQKITGDFVSSRASARSRSQRSITSRSSSG